MRNGNMINIRKARKEDIQELLSIQILDKENYWRRKDFSASINDRKVIFLVAELNKKLIGYIIGYKSPTKLSDIMIHETRVNINYRKKGVGEKLVNTFCKEAFNKGAKDIYALVDKGQNLKFYKNTCGFKTSNNWIEVKKSKRTLKKNL